MTRRERENNEEEVQKMRHGLFSVSDIVCVSLPLDVGMGNNVNLTFYLLIKNL